jgi:hypothetical protein
MKAEEIEVQELAALYDEKRDKLNARLAVWSLLLTLFGAVGYASVQPGLSGYLGVLYPLLAATIARFAGHSERILDRVKQRIYRIEQDADYCGYEHENAEQPHKGSGGHLKALRDFILLTDAVAIVVIVVRFLLEAVQLPQEARIGVAAFMVLPLGAVMLVTWHTLLDHPAHSRQGGSKPSAVWPTEERQVTK